MTLLLSSLSLLDAHGSERHLQVVMETRREPRLGAGGMDRDGGVDVYGDGGIQQSILLSPIMAESQTQHRKTTNAHLQLADGNVCYCIITLGFQSEPDSSHNSYKSQLNQIIISVCEGKTQPGRTC